MIVFLTALLAIPAAAQSPAFMKKAPDVAPLAGFAVPTRERFTLDNGLEVVFVRNRRAPLLTVQLAFRGASRIVGRGGEGTAEAFAALLTGGTPRMDAKAIAEAADGFGGTIEGSAGADNVALSAFGLAEKSDQVLALLDHCAFDSSFPEGEVRLRRENMIEELSIKRGQSDYLATVAYERSLFGAHPYGLVPTEASIAKIDRQGLRALHAKASVPSNMVLYVVGDIERERLNDLLKETLGLRVGRGALTVPPFPELRFDAGVQRRVLVLNRPGSEQAVLRIGHRAPRETHSDYPALQVVNMALGGSFAARLTMDLREKRGYTYGIYSSLPSWRSAGAFRIGAQVRTTVAKKSLKLVLGHLKKLRRRGITEEELRQAKNLLVTGFVREFETQEGIVEAIAHADLRGLPHNYLDTYVARIQAITREQARAAARAHIHPDSAALVVVGDAAALERSLRRLSKPPLARVDENGAVIAP